MFCRPMTDRRYSTNTEECHTDTEEAAEADSILSPSIKSACDRAPAPATLLVDPPSVHLGSVRFTTLSRRCLLMLPTLNFQHRVDVER